MSRGSAARMLLAMALAGGSAGLLTAQKPDATPAAGAKKADSDQTQLPPEEDKADIPQVYSFNPLQSKKEISVGEFYFKKGDYRAAAIRFREATKWNDGNAEAWLRLAETEEKNHSPEDARAAYQKYLKLSPTAKNAPEIRKRLEKLPG